MTMTWAGTIAANAVIVLVSIVTVVNTTNIKAPTTNPKLGRV